jgi:hypothetical protein
MINEFGLAATPPMGWNSWDCFGTAVTEDEVLGNAMYMAEHLRSLGYEYIVIDIRWYVPEPTYAEIVPGGRESFVDCNWVLDEYGRPLPAVNRFPSAAGEKGFAPLASPFRVFTPSELGASAKVPVL